MHGIHCIPLLSDPVHQASAQYTTEPLQLQGVENDITRKNYVPSSFKNSCPGIKMLNDIESKPVKVFVMNICDMVACMPACNLHCVIFLCIYFCIV